MPRPGYINDYNTAEPNFTMPASSGGYRTFNPSGWGNQGNSVDQNGKNIAGTSGADLDVNRYKALANGGQTTGPQIDASQSNETRGMSMGGIGMLGDTAANGNASTAALMAKQTQDAQNAQYSMGASVRGGAMARAAAARGAAMGAATAGQVGAQQAAATRAGEMATARGAYLGAASGQRGQDLGLATSQSNLDMGQRQQNEQRNEYYGNLGYGVKKAQTDAQLGRSAGDEAASNTARTQALNEAGQSDANTQRIVGTAVGGGTGLVSGYAGYQAGQTGQGKSALPTTMSTSSSGANPYDPNYTGSDERMKEGVMPLYAPEGTELHMSDKGKGYLASNAPDTATGASLSGPVPRYGSAPREASAPPAAAKAKPAYRKMTDDELDRAADAMLGNVRAQKDSQIAAGPSVHDSHEPPAWLQQEMARDLTTSDERAKETPEQKKAREDKEDAAKTAEFMKDAKPVAAGPAEPTGYEAQKALIEARNRQEESEKEQAAERRRAAQAPAIAFANRNDVEAQGAANKLQYVPLVGPWAQGKVAERAAQSDDQKAARGIAERKDQIERLSSRARLDARLRGMLPDSVREWADNSPAQFGYRPDQDSRQPVRQPTSFTRETATSDERAKDVQDASPMSGAMRSMAPSVYEYKPGYAEEAGQREGEKNVGPMAQNMAADPVAGTAIVKRPDGMLAIDKDKGLKLVMGGVADLQMQLDALKKKRGA